MSHAWNACGVHAPRGFKSHILRQRKSRLLLHSMEPGFLLYTGARPRLPTPLPSSLIDDRRLVAIRLQPGLRVKMCVWLGVSRGLDLAFLNAD